MRIFTSDAARMVGLGRSHFQRMTRVLGMRPVHKDASKRGGARYFWSVSQVVALLASGRLVRAGVSVDAAADFAKKLAKSNDEQLEAAFASGRHYAMVCGNSVCRDAMFLPNIIDAAKQRADALSDLGLTIVAFDILPLFNEVMAAARALNQANAEAN